MGVDPFRTPSPHAPSPRFALPEKRRGYFRSPAPQRRAALISTARVARRLRAARPALARCPAAAARREARATHVSSKCCSKVASIPSPAQDPGTRPAPNLGAPQSRDASPDGASDGTNFTAAPRPNSRSCVWPAEPGSPASCSVRAFYPSVRTVRFDMDGGTGGEKRRGLWGRAIPRTRKPQEGRWLNVSANLTHTSILSCDGAQESLGKESSRVWDLTSRENWCGTTLKKREKL